MSEKLQAVVDSVAELSVLELSELIKMLEEKFGVEASAGAPMMMGAMPAMAGGAAGGGEAAADEGPTEFDVILSDAGGQKIQVIKEVRALTGLGLKEAKALVDEAPKPIKEGANEDEAKEIKEKLEGAGATVELKGK